MKKWIKLVLVSAVIVMSVMPAAMVAEGASAHAKEECLSPAKVKLGQDLRSLWADHVIWTRNYIVSDVAGLADKDATLQRLLKNQEDLGNAFKPYYGVAAGNKLIELLKEHIVLAGKVVDAAKSSNQADLEKYNKEWYRNADDIVKYLSSLNPNWTEKELRDMLYTHLKLVTEDAVARISKNWPADIAAFDKNLDHMMMLADVLSTGIIKQFPDKFK